MMTDTAHTLAAGSEVRELRQFISECQAPVTD